jgi:hypothetical protein
MDRDAEFAAGYTSCCPASSWRTSASPTSTPILTTSPSRRSQPSSRAGVPFVVTVLEDSAEGHTFTAVTESPAVISNALWRTRIFNDAIQHFGDPDNMMDAALDGNDLYVVLSTDRAIINDVFTPDEIAAEGMAADLDLPE